MRSFICFLLVLVSVSTSCNKTSPSGGFQPRKYSLQGQIVALDPERKLVTVSHGDIPGFMPAMTMPYAVKDARALAGITPGDLIKATLSVESSGPYLIDMKKVGSAPLEAPPAPTSAAPSASSGFELLKPGEAVPDAMFLDQDGKTRNFSAFKGQTVVLTFIYTKCPMPTFCPLMDRHFAAIQKALLEGNPARNHVHLVSVSFDPLVDTPPVLKKHAKELAANPAWWTFLTGDRDEIDRFAARFGVSVARNMNDQRDITHNLRTAIVDPDGKLVRIYTGNEWTPEQVLADLQ